MNNEAHDPAEKNIRKVAELEREAMRRRSLGERISDIITKFIGSMTFVVLHVILFLVWFVVNLNVIPNLAPFDPFPFGILTLIVSAEGVFLGIFVLISQNRMARLSDRRDHLDLQINLLAEQEMTRVLDLLQKISNHLGLEEVAGSKEVEELIKDTEVNRLFHQLEEHLPDE